MIFAPFGGYDPSLDVLDRSALVKSVADAPPGALCWVFVAPRRGGKTWTLKALQHHIGNAAKYVDAQGHVLPAQSLERGSTLLVDEPGYTLHKSGATFIDQCRALHAEGVRTVVAMTPAEYAMLVALCEGGVGDVTRALLHVRSLTPTEQAQLASRDPRAAALLPSVPAAWRAFPFLLELYFAAMESDTSLTGPLQIAHRAVTIAEDQYSYTRVAWCDGLSAAQREAVRSVLRGVAGPTSPATDTLVSAGVLAQEQGGRRRVADPILAAQLAVLRIHHVSDVHVGPKSYRAVDDKSGDPALGAMSGPEFVRDRYIEHLAQRRADGTGPHMLVCSGDCVEYASDASQYDIFASWLEQAERHLVPHPAIPSAQRTLLVGGNHDVDWNLAATGARERHAAFAKMVAHRPHPSLEEDPATRSVAQVAFVDAGVCVALLGSAEHGGTVQGDRFRGALLGAVDAAKRIVPPGDATLQKRVDDLRARLDGDPVVELRSALDAMRAGGVAASACDVVEDEYRKVMRIDPGLVHDRDLGRLRAHDWQLPVRIAVLHHPVSPLPETEVARFGGIINAGAVKEALLEKGFQLVLHGHVHRGWFSQETLWASDGTQRTLAVAAAPTLGSSETAKDQGFNEVEVLADYDDERRAFYEVRVRRYARENATWHRTASEMCLPRVYR